MTLTEIIQRICENVIHSMQLTDLRTGTVTSEDPLEITVDTTMQPLKAGSLCLTEPVVEKKIPVLQHKHTIHDTYTGGGSCEDSLLESDIICKEYGEDLPVEDGYIILNRKLEKGDKVLLLRVENGQKFIVLSRVF